MEAVRLMPGEVEVSDLAGDSEKVRLAPAEALPSGLGDGSETMRSAPTKVETFDAAGGTEHPAEAPPLDTASRVTIRDTIARATVTSTFKEGFSQASAAAPITSLAMAQVEEAGIAFPRDLTAVVPGLVIPDYGSSMTSSIYVRGLGSRIDNPVIGLYIDDIPVMDKNAYDLSFLDLRRVDMYRGPNGTLYGRNSMVGVLSLQTLSPTDYQGFRAALEYGSANSLNARASFYKGSFGAAVAYRHSDGFYENEYDGDDDMDRIDMLSFRFKFARVCRKAEIDNTLSLSFTDQGGYPYRQYTDEDGLLPVSYNDESSYRRISAIDGFRVGFSGDGWRLSSMTSVQLLYDDMTLDQDFTTSSMFTLSQRQHQGSVTQELVLKVDKGPKWWSSQTGLFGFYKRNNISAPVTFLQDGIDNLILSNANANIPSSVGQVVIEESEFTVSGDFGVNTYNVAAYHESYFRFGHWLVTAGLRLDHEGGSMDYDSRSAFNYKFDSAYFDSDYSTLSTVYEGHLSNSYFQILPKLSIQYEIPTSEGLSARVYGLVSKGYTAGGFNCQIFSDIMQNRIMLDMMSGMSELMESMTGRSLDLSEYDSGIDAEDIKYKPETCYNYELGGEFTLARRGHSLRLAATLYHIDCRDQQITVFPLGDGTGRMMANAGKSRSNGVEGELSWAWRGWNVQFSYNLTDAQFVEYDDGVDDYSGNDIPYSPRSTLYGRLSRRFELRSGYLRAVSAYIDYDRTGHISWNESGTMSQHPYSLLGAGFSLDFPHASLYLRAQNLTDTSYSSFYFKSVNNSFFQRGKPRRLTVGISLNF